MRVPADPAKAIWEHLRREVPHADAGGQLPEDWQPETSRPFLLVGDDGGSVNWPVSTTCRVRVAAFARGRSEARFLAAQAQAALISRDVLGIAHVSRFPTAILDARDPHNHAWLAVFTAE
ncbi:conserved hypothetical protein [Segniliparus rotundus DSM 44985]|uniref:Uncharacterized protein n=1 Tax=Segniliparus rotundus (strain ATCC BAA-972 / CDC 1076 / CIP 108378 / DSM 44985 / JCM 13578) TaxID=640132 RepID=D6ZFA6_SEGRD|nr:hypothetical protein [Segniliparus rotundus]ADG97630.1 conserved hypothetical protein [Segniliparus rotundus DSM 44985]